MKTIDRINSLLAQDPNLSNADLAHEIGVSRQRISDLCRKNGIKLKRAYPRRQKKSPPVPRVITGGVEVSISETVCGSISEILVAADLLARGFRAYMPIVKQRSHDVIAVDSKGKTLTVEVRSGKGRADGNGYTWSPKSKKDCLSEYQAVVLTGRPVIYKPDLPKA